MQEIMIDPEFENLIPPLTVDEYTRLEESVLSEGCREALVLWNKTLVDGHNRYAICKEHRLEFKTVQHSFKDRDEVKLWIMKNQLARRNLNEAQRINIVKKCEPSVKAKAEERMLAGKSDPRENLPKGRATDELGKLAGVSRKTYEHASAVYDSAPESVAQAMDNGSLSINKAHEVLKATEEQQAEIADRLEHIENEPEETNTPAKIVNDVLKPHVSFNSGNNEWYTPAEYIELAKKVMGDIDVDPASCEYANKTIQAKQYYDIANDGLAKDWNGRIWMNPPYGKEYIEKFVDKFVSEFERKNIKEGIVLVNNATETGWFKKLANVASAIVFPSGRIRFNSPTKESLTPLQGQAFLYFGEWKQNFINEFGTLGTACKVVKLDG